MRVEKLTTVSGVKKSILGSGLSPAAFRVSAAASPSPVARGNFTKVFPASQARPWAERNCATRSNKAGWLLVIVYSLVRSMILFLEVLGKLRVDPQDNLSNMLRRLHEPMGIGHCSQVELGMNQWQATALR